MTTINRLQFTLLDERFRIMRCKKFYGNTEAMQEDLGIYIVSYITEHPHQGKKGTIPADIFARCLPNPRTPKESNSQSF